MIGSTWPRNPLRTASGIGVLLVCISGSTWTAAAYAGEAVVASATNFAEVLERLETEFESTSGHRLKVVTGSTGKLYAQIVNGAPFDVFLAADRIRPRLLEENGMVVSGTRFTYAVGRLALWSPDADRILDGAATLRRGDFRRLAMANADLAPYGTAARQALENLGLYERLQGRLAVGENIGQAWAMVATGNAELGLVALSYIVSPRNETRGSYWEVPPGLHDAIRQDAARLRRARDNAAAIAFMDWLRADFATSVIERYGYRVE